MATLFEVLQFTDNSGNPISGGLVYWENAGLTTPKTTWKDAGESATHTYPIVLDIAGRPPGGATFIRGSYKLRVKDSTNSITYVTIDNINEYNQYDFTGLTASIADLNSTKTTALNINSTFTTVLSHRGNTLLCDATSASFDVNLLPSATALNTYEITIKKVDVSVNTVSIIPNGTEKIDTDIDFTLYDFNDFVKLHSDGSNWKVIASQIRGTIVTQAAAATLTLEDNGKLFNCDASSGSFQIDLPDCRAVGRGYKLSFKKIDSSAVNAINLKPYGTQTIDGSSLYSLETQYQAVDIKTDGLNWFITNETNQSSAVFYPGFVMPSYSPSEPGWIKADDQEIGNAASGARTRANEDCLDLFTVWWTYLDSRALVLRSSRGGPIVPKGVTAKADFDAGRVIDLPKLAGRSLMNIGSASPEVVVYNGMYTGGYYQSLSVEQLPAHHHQYRWTLGGGIGSNGLSSGSIAAWLNSQSGDTGDGQTFSIIHPIGGLYFLIKL